MAKTVVGLFDSFGEAQRAVDDLMHFGVRREEISLVARDEYGAMREREAGGSEAAEGAGAGAVGGSLVGGALGLLVGTGLLVIPGIGPVLAAGPLAAGIGTMAAAAGATALGAGLGAAAGGLLGGLMGAGVPENEAEAYIEGLRRGGTLLSVQTADTEADDVREILIRNGAIDMDERTGEWRASGWGADTAEADERSIPRGDAYSISGHQAAEDYQDSSKAGTATGAAAGAATGAVLGAAGGPVGSVVGGVAGAVTGGAAGAAGDVAGERAEESAERRYDFKDGDLNDVDRKVVDTSYTDVNRTGERVKDTGFASGNNRGQTAPEAYDEFLTQDERTFRTPENTRTGADRAADAALTGGTSAYRGDGFNTIDRNETMGAADTAADMDRPAQGDLLSESSRRNTQFGGADEMGGAMGDMRGGSGSAQPGRASSPSGRVRIYDNTRAANRAAATDDLPAHGDFARGMRDEAAPAVEPDFARGMHSDPRVEETGHALGSRGGADADVPHHGDFARGMRQEQPEPLAPDYARGQRGYEQYDTDFIAHHRTMTGSGGQPYDYYKPGYQFGFDMANNPAYRHDSWAAAERDARQGWERDARGSWEEFKDTIRYGWEKARGRRQ